ncbi:hypothetical protein Tco_0607090, partial [Tanacetum coccineum]
MPSWASSESQVISGRIEYYCKCNRRLPLQPETTRKNPGKRFVTCSVCMVYDFLDDDLPSEYYKELLYGTFQKQKQLKKHIEYDQVIDVLALDKSMLEEEFRAAKTKLKLYDSCKWLSFECKQYGNAKWLSFSFKWLSFEFKWLNACYKCKLQMLATKQKAVNACSKANASCKLVCSLQMLAANVSCKCLQQSKYKLQMLVAKQMQAGYACRKCFASYKCLQQSKCKLQMPAAKQMQAANACIKANASCKCLQSKCKLRMLVAKQMQVANRCGYLHSKGLAKNIIPGDALAFDPDDLAIDPDALAFDLDDLHFRELSTISSEVLVLAESELLSKSKLLSKMILMISA